MDKDRFSTLLAKKMAGEASPDELRELQDYLQAHANDRQFADLFQTFWDSGAGREHPESETHFQQVMRKAAEAGPDQGVPAAKHGSRFRRRLFRAFMAAAAVVALAVFGWTFFPRIGQRPELPSVSNEIVIQRGAKSKVTLPDGSQVWLNSESRLIYPGAFGGERREVSLEGEGYFIVAKDPAKPFVVHTPDVDIRVLGTVFNVKAYNSDETVETTLLRGSVAVERRNTPDASRIVLKPREKLIIQRRKDPGSTPAGNESGPETRTPVSQTTPPAQAQLLTVTLLPQNVPDSVRTETSWVYGRLVFEGDHFHELALKLERWYNKKITVRNSRVANYRFTGMFENETLEEALRALQLTAPFSFRIDGNEVFIDKP